MNYLLSGDNNTFDILEKNTDVKIVLETTKQKADLFCKQLNKGSGFAGFTPDFFANLKGQEMERE